MLYSDVLAYLESRDMERKTMDLGLSRIRETLNRLGNPEKSLKVIHIAGTNGKGSTAAMISSILREAGFRVGLYTSPHLTDVRERIQINGEKISEEDIENLSDKITNEDLTYFEFLTVLAILHFNENKVDFGVFEVGLGGRLDATNVLHPLISVITSISFDHQKHLGGTIESIAREKCGIIKKGKSTVARRDNLGFGIIEKTARERRNKLYFASDCDHELSLLGDFQRENAGVALEAINALKDLGYDVKEDHVRAGLLKTRWPGRMEIVSQSPLTMLDCAHNPSGMRALKKSVEKLKHGRLILVFGASADKDYEGMLSEISPVADRIILTRAGMERALDPERMMSLARNPIVISDPREAMEKARGFAGKGDLILAAGSIYLIGDILKGLENPSR